MAHYYLSNKNDHLVYFDVVGFGVFTTEVFKKGDFLLEYVGERLSVSEAEEREKKYPENKLFFFNHKGRQQWYV